MFSKVVGLLQMRIARKDEGINTQRSVLLHKARDGGAIPNHSGPRAPTDLPNTGP
jgi:hypothetical protein